MAGDDPSGAHSVACGLHREGIVMDAESPSSVFDSVAVATLRPGDVVLFRCANKISGETRAQVFEMLNEVFPHHESVILDAGQDIAVLRPEHGWFRRMFRKVTA